MRRSTRHLLDKWCSNGATVHQLMAIYGWETLKQAEIYTRETNMALLAEEAMHLLVPARRTNGARKMSHLPMINKSATETGV